MIDPEPYLLMFTKESNNDKKEEHTTSLLHGSQWITVAAKQEVQILLNVKLKERY
jgi:hypothetical protein